MKYHSAESRGEVIRWLKEEEKKIGEQEILLSIRDSDNKCETFCNMIEVLELTEGMRVDPVEALSFLEIRQDVYWCMLYEFNREGGVETTISVLIRNFSPRSIGFLYDHYREVPLTRLTLIADALNRCVKDFDKLKETCIKEGFFTEKEFDKAMVKRTMSR